MTGLFLMEPHFESTIKLIKTLIPNQILNEADLFDLFDK